MKANKKIIFITFLIFLMCMLVCCAIVIYAKYINGTPIHASMYIAKWDIKVGDLSIGRRTDISGQIVPNFPATDNKPANMIAPGSTGTVTLTLDFTNVEVPCTYKITPTVPLENGGDIGLAVILYRFKHDDDEWSNFIETPATGYIENTRLLNGPTHTSFELTVKWPDLGTTDGDKNDVLFAQSGINAQVNVDVSIEQIVN